MLAVVVLWLLLGVVLLYGAEVQSWFVAKTAAPVRRYPTRLSVGVPGQNLLAPNGKSQARRRFSAGAGSWGGWEEECSTDSRGISGLKPGRT